MRSPACDWHWYLLAKTPRFICTKMGLLISKIWSLFGNEGELLNLFLGSTNDICCFFNFQCLTYQIRFVFCNSCKIKIHDAKNRLISIKKTHIFISTEHKLVLVGLDNAGKTTILYQLLLGEAVHTRPTIGSNVEEIVWKNLRFVMWDLGGQQSLRSAWNTYYTNSEVRKSNWIYTLYITSIRFLLKRFL